MPERMKRASPEDPQVGPDWERTVAISSQAKLIVWTKAAGRCSFPDCRLQLVLDIEPTGGLPVGEIAHIVAEKPDGPRGSHQLASEYRSQPPNLLLLCPNHHTEIDKAPSTYTIERLREFKRRHENWVRQTLNRPDLAGRRLSSDTPLVKETLHSTILPVERVPLTIFSAPPKVPDEEAITAELKRRIPFVVHDKQLFTFETLSTPDNAFGEVINHRQATKHNAAEWWADPNRKRLYVYLLGRCMNKITGRLGLMLDRKHNRYFFVPETVGVERKVTYRPLNQSTSEICVVWQPIQKSTGKPYGYWLHRAVSFQFVLVSSQQWLLALRPEFHVTTDGQTELEASDIGAKVTHKKAKLYNHGLLVEVNFWRDLLAEGQPRIIYRFDRQKLVIGTTLVQAEVLWPGVPGDRQSFRNVVIPENLFSLAELNELAELEDADDEYEDDDAFDGDE